jgi:uncharacterized protein with HEPN domain
MRTASNLLGLDVEGRRPALSIAGMRNILVHGYAEIKYDILYDVIVNRLGDLEEILVELWNKALELDP